MSQFPKSHNIIFIKGFPHNNINFLPYTYIDTQIQNTDKNVQH